jgi:hypothetical protein
VVEVVEEYEEGPHLENDSVGEDEDEDDKYAGRRSTMRMRRMRRMRMRMRKGPHLENDSVVALAETGVEFSSGKLELGEVNLLHLDLACKEDEEDEDEEEGERSASLSGARGVGGGGHMLLHSCGVEWVGVSPGPM